MAKGYIPRGTIKDPLAEGLMGVPRRPSTSYVAHGGDPLGVEMDNPGPDSKGDQ